MYLPFSPNECTYSSFFLEDALETLLVLLLSPKILKERDTDPECKYPSLFRSSCDVVLDVEGEDIVPIELKALLWGVSFYVFNIRNGTTANNLNWFLREKIFNLQQENNVSDRMLRTVADLGKYI